MVHCVLLELVSHKERGQRFSFIVYGISFLAIFFSFLFIPLFGCKTSSLSEMYELSKVCFD